MQTPRTLLNERWSAAMEDKLRKLWADGATIPLIAATLGVTVDAVKGKRNRLKLPNRHIGRLVIRKVRLIPEPAHNTGLTLLALEAGACRWPYGDPKAASFHFCGAAAVEKKSYCAAHMQKATFDPAVDR